MERSDSVDSMEKELDYVIEEGESKKLPLEEPVAVDENLRDTGVNDSDNPKDNGRDMTDNEKSKRESVLYDEGYEDSEGDKSMSPDSDDPDMRLDLAYTDEEPPPEYDVTERVRQLNEELANDPTPMDDRERSIKFKENLIDFEAPPPDYSESDFEDPEEEKKETSDEIDGSSSPRSQEQKEEIKGDGEASGASEKEKNDDEEKVLIERGGKFELVNSSELSSDEKELYGVKTSDSEDDRPQHSPQPPSSPPRPATANGTSSNSRGHHSGGRVQSATLPPIRGSEFDADGFNYISPYALSDKEKEILRKQKKEKEQREQRLKGEKSKKENDKQQEADEAFQAWLKKKRDEAAANRQQRSEMKKREDEEKRANVSDEDMESHDSDGAFKEWCKVKKQQKQKDRQTEQCKQQEVNEGWYTRPRSQCNQAFKEWLKKKNQEQQKNQKEEKQRARVHRLLARRCRKSMALARAIKQSQSFRYVDYYGYR